jgi:hypothetical protein
MVYLQITLKIAPANRPAAAGVYQRYKAPFLTTGMSRPLLKFGGGLLTTTRPDDPPLS